MNKRNVIVFITTILVTQSSLSGCSLFNTKSDNNTTSSISDSISEENTHIKSSDLVGTLSLDDGFTSNIITDKESALSAVNDVADVIGISNTSDELVIESESSVEDYDFYRFKQMYNGIEVYGKEVIVVADDSDKAFSLSSTYDPVLNINLESELSKDEVEKIVSNSDMFVNAEDYEIEYIDKCIYFINNNPVLCYKYSVYGKQNDRIYAYTVLADSNDGSIVYQDENIEYDSTYYDLNEGAIIVNDISFNGEDNNPRNVDISEYNNQYQMYDLKREIGVWRAANKLSSNWFRLIDFELDIQNVDHYIWDKNTDCPSKVGITSLKNIQDTYDYYKESLNWISTDGKGQYPIWLITDDLSMHNNAAFLNYENTPVTVISIGTNDDSITPGNYLDVMSHEFTHSVSNNIVGWKSKQGNAMNEAYSDILGEAVEYYITGSNDWKINKYRNIANPSDNMDEKGKHITRYSDYKDSIDCHLSSTLISHTAYLMNVGYDDDTHSNTAINMDTLGKLWFYSLQFLPSDCSFADCRRAVSLSADILNARGIYVPYYTINKAFDEAGIGNLNPYYSVKSDFTLSVYESDKKTKVSDYHLIISKYENGNFDNTVFEGDVSEESYSLSLESGDYLFTIQGKAEHQYVTALNVKVGEWFCENDHIDFYSYWYNNSHNGNSKKQDSKKEQSEAEKYAQIVINNEKLWYDPWLSDGDEYAPINSTYAWFQDLNFDGKLEFIVGTQNIMGQSMLYGFDIFEFTNEGEMHKITDGNTMIYDRSIIFSPHFDGVRAGMPGFVYESDGKYTYIYDDVNNSISTTGFRMSELTIVKGNISTNTLFDYLYAEPGETIEYYKYKDKNLSKKEIISKLEEQINNSTFYRAKIGTVPFSDKEAWITDPNDETLSDAAGAVISACYDGLSDKDKLQAFVDSYNAYSLVECDWNYFELMHDELNSILPTNNSLSESDLKNMIENSSSGTLYSWDYADYDGDGNKEAFANFVDEYSYFKEIRFIDSDGNITVMRDEPFGMFTSNIVGVDYEGRRFATLSSALGQAWRDRTLIYGVKDNVPYELILSGEINDLYIQNGKPYTNEYQFGDNAQIDFWAVPLELKYDADSKEFLL